MVLAAGKGERLGSEGPKVLAEVCGRPMLSWILEEAGRLRPARVHVVVGKDGSEVARALRGSGARTVTQPRRNGTADAARVGLAKVPDRANALVLFGDTPLVRAAGLRRLVAAAGSGRLGIRTMAVSSPHGYSRVIRDARGGVSALVVEREAGPAERRIREVDAGGMAFPAAWGKRALATVRRNRHTREYPLTDLVAAALKDGMRVAAVEVAEEDGLGVNTKAELLHTESVMSARLVDAMAGKGALFADRGSVLVRGDVRAAAGAFVDRNVILEGRVRIAAGCSVGPNCVVRDTDLAAGAAVRAFSHVDGARLGRDSSAGPFARIRPGTVLRAGAKVGNFVETKAAELGEGAKANHLSYLGDGTVGPGANVGAGTVFCNYDGLDKHRTEVGEGSFIGSGSMLVAPVTIGRDAVVAAGSVVTKDVGDGETAFGRARQVNTRRRRRKKAR